MFRERSFGGSSGVVVLAGWVLVNVWIWGSSLCGRIERVHVGACL